MQRPLIPSQVDDTPLRLPLAGSGCRLRRIRVRAARRCAVRCASRRNPVGTTSFAPVRPRGFGAAPVVLDRRRGHRVHLFAHTFRTACVDAGARFAARRTRCALRSALQQRPRQSLPRQPRFDGLAQRQRTRARRRTGHRLVELRRAAAISFSLARNAQGGAGARTRAWEFAGHARRHAAFVSARFAEGGCSRGTAGQSHVSFDFFGLQIRARSLFSPPDRH